MTITIGKWLEVEVRLWSLYVRLGKHSLFLSKGLSALNNTPL